MHSTSRFNALSSPARLLSSFAQRRLHQSPSLLGVFTRRLRAINRPTFTRFYSAAIAPHEYEWIDGAERLEKYTAGGYHPTQIGDVFRDRYEVIDKLGYGGWSTVWLTRDFQKKQYVALKVGIADSLPLEVTVLHALGKQTTVPGSATIPRVLDEFRIEGPNGSHPCYTTAPALCSLRQSSFSRLFYLDVARALAYELALAVAYVHSRGYVHGDIHLRNVLVSAQQDFNQLSVAQFREEYGEPDSYPVRRLDGQPLTPNVPPRAVVPLCIEKKAHEFTLQDAHTLLNDFGESFAPAEEPRLGKDCHTPVDFRPPEAHFEPNTPLSFSADVWSLATAIWDILGMQALFSSAFYSDAQLMCQIVDALGPLPADWLDKWEDRGDFFDAQGKPTPGRYVWPKIQEAFEERVQQFRRDDDMGEFCAEETAAILDMMVQMLRYRPDERPTVQQVLQSGWMVKWARADYERSRMIHSANTKHS